MLRNDLFSGTRILLMLCLCLFVSGVGNAEEENAVVPTVSTPDNHPLRPVLKFAEDALLELDEVRDYTCVLVKRERVDGRLSGYVYMSAKIRHEQKMEDRKKPFGVYLHFLRPAKVNGREVLYVAGRTGDNFLARRGGSRLGSVTTWLKTDSQMAMKENRYPITDIGLRNLVLKLAEVAREDIKHDECKVQYFKDARVDGRKCTHIRVTHPEPRDHFRFHQADIYVDNGLRVPIRYVAYQWPTRPGDAPRLVEEYNYMKVKLNVGLTDKDFDRNNPDYGFRKERGFRKEKPLAAKLPTASRDDLHE